MQPTLRSRHPGNWIEIRAQEQLSGKKVGDPNSMWMTRQRGGGWSDCGDSRKGDRSHAPTRWVATIFVLQNHLRWLNKVS